VPDVFEVPLVLETPLFCLKKLTKEDAKKDYEAIMSSIEYLQGTFGPNSIWPVKDLTVKENLLSIELHEKEFESKTTFAYSITSLEQEYLGCAYIYPSDKEGFDAVAFTWVRESKKQVDKEVYKIVKKWLEEKWPFKNIAWPGRNISWDEWNAP